jgi:hypothetical protein
MKTYKSIPSKVLSKPQLRLLGFAAALLATASIVTLLSTDAIANANQPTWRPAVSEKLVKLPNSYLKKALDRDFSDSPLAEAIRSADSEINLKMQTLADLQSATDQAEGDVLTELRHQFLAQKQEYLSLMKNRQDLKTRHHKTRIKIYQRLLKKMSREHSGQSSEKAKLVESQIASRARFEKSSEAIDMKMFASAIAPESRYSKEYSKNLSAANALLQAISAHPMNAKHETDGVPVSKPDYVRNLLASAESELSLISQEGEIVGYMAKLVALDAMALADQVAESDPDLAEPDKSVGISSAVGLFIQ